MTRLLYRGISYDNARHELPSDAPVQHAYRGLHFDRALRHEPAAVDLVREFRYRGSSYHHQPEVSHS